MSNLCIIPARGGSKGIPHKNVRLLAGKPLIAHTIEQAHQSAHIDRIVVSTDDAKIAAVAQTYNAEIIWRPAEISGDFASSEDALLHTLDYLAHSEQYVPMLTIFLQCTSPLTLAEDIDGTVEALLHTEADSALAVTPFHYFLWEHCEANGEAIGINHDKQIRLLRQQREPQYLETGAVYVMRTDGFRQAKQRFFCKTAMYVMPNERCHEIDEPVDLEVAEVLMRKQQTKQSIAMLPDQIAALVLDFDGVFTDNKVILSQNGLEAVICDRSDGWGLAQLRKLNLPMLVLSSEENPVVQTRCSKLGIPCQHGVTDKLPVLTNWLSEHRIELSKAVYVGNDVNDIDCLQSVGCGVVVQDADPMAKEAARIVLSQRGGRGAIRELVNMILQKQEHCS